jgi:hypothetical protein
MGGWVNASMEMDRERHRRQQTGVSRPLSLPASGGPIDDNDKGSACHAPSSSRRVGTPALCPGPSLLCLVSDASIRSPAQSCIGPLTDDVLVVVVVHRHAREARLQKWKDTRMWREGGE